MNKMENKTYFLYQFVNHLIWNLMEINLQGNTTEESVLQ